MIFLINLDKLVYYLRYILSESWEQTELNGKFDTLFKIELVWDAAPDDRKTVDLEPLEINNEEEIIDWLMSETDDLCGQQQGFLNCSHNYVDKSISDDINYFN